MADEPAASISDSSDPTPYIRTYAKDVARLTGTQAARKALGKEAPTPGVQFGEVDFSQSQGTRSEEGTAREFKQEILSITDEDTLANSTAASAPLPEDKRDEILSRLREKVQKAPASAVSQSSMMPSSPVSIQPHAAVVPAASDELSSASSLGAPSAPESVPAQNPAFTPQPIPVPAPPPLLAQPAHAFPFFSHHAPEKKASDPVPSNLHTFKSDFADHIDAEKASTFSVLAAQSDYKDTRVNTVQQAKISSKKSKLPLILGSALLVFLGIGMLGGVAWVVLRMPHATVPFTVPSLIFADENVEIPSTAASPTQGVIEIAAQASVKGNVVVVYTTTTTSGKQGVIKIPLLSGALVKHILESAPDILLRNIDDTSTVGVINAGNNNAPFFVLHVTSYERTFAGMLGWEPTVGADLAQLYPASAQASSGTGTTSRFITSSHFIDSTVANHNVRIFKDANDQTILLYGFRDKKTLIIAKDEAAFSALLIRLSAATGS